MKTIVLSVPSGSHHRALLQPLASFFRAQNDWHIRIISPGAPWADELFPTKEYPRDRFSFSLIDEKSWNASETQRMLSDLYTELSPTLVLTTTTGRDVLDRPILSAAKKHGIRTCTYIESWDNVWKMARKRNEQVLPDHLIVWNTIMKEHLLREFPEVTFDRVSITGSPRLDLSTRKDLFPPREKLFARLGMDPSRPLLHFSTVELYDMSHVATAIGEARVQGGIPKDLQLFATVHPGGNFERHETWAKKYGYKLRHAFGRKDAGPHPDFLYNPTVEDNAYLMALFAEEDILVNFSSTTALEAILMDTPTIGVMYGRPLDWWNWRRSAIVRDFKEHYVDLVRDGGIHIVRNRRQLLQAINSYLRNPAQDREGRKRSSEVLMTTLAGDASQKTFDVIRSLV